jgi:sialidase-1
MNLYTRWSANLYLPWYELFAGDLKNGHHVLRLRIAKTKDPKSKGHACKIVYFLVNKE